MQSGIKKTNSGALTALPLRWMQNLKINDLQIVQQHDRTVIRCSVDDHGGCGLCGKLHDEHSGKGKSCIDLWAADGGGTTTSSLVFVKGRCFKTSCIQAAHDDPTIVMKFKIRLRTVAGTVVLSLERNSKQRVPMTTEQSDMFMKIYQTLWPSSTSIVCGRLLPPLSPQ